MTSELTVSDVQSHQAQLPLSDHPGQNEQSEQSSQDGSPGMGQSKSSRRRRRKRKSKGPETAGDGTQQGGEMMPGQAVSSIQGAAQASPGNSFQAAPQNGSGQQSGSQAT